MACSGVLGCRPGMQLASNIHRSSVARQPLRPAAALCPAVRSSSLQTGTFATRSCSNTLGNQDWTNWHACLLTGISSSRRSSLLQQRQPCPSRKVSTPAALCCNRSCCSLCDCALYQMTCYPLLNINQLNLSSSRICIASASVTWHHRILLTAPISLTQQHTRIATYKQSNTIIHGTLACIRQLLHLHLLLML
jgi:hypothetical protein